MDHKIFEAMDAKWTALREEGAKATNDLLDNKIPSITSRDELAAYASGVLEIATTAIRACLNTDQEFDIILSAVALNVKIQYQVKQKSDPTHTIN